MSCNFTYFLARRSTAVMIVRCVRTMLDDIFVVSVSQNSS